MKISARNFIATQALYSLVIAHPNWVDQKEHLCKEAFELADEFLKVSQQKRKTQHYGNKRPKKISR